MMQYNIFVPDRRSKAEWEDKEIITNTAQTGVALFLTFVIADTINLIIPVFTVSMLTPKPSL